MKELDISKIKSIAVVIIMALSVLTASFVFIGEQNTVKAAGGTAGGFTITNPTVNNTKYPVGKTINVTWGTSANAEGYHLAITRAGVGTTTNVTSADNTKEYYRWTPRQTGTHVLTIYAWNGTNYTYAFLNNVTVHIVNTPGYNGWQGANTTVNTENPLKDGTTDPENDLYYGNTLDIYLNTSATWGTGSYNLYYPVYKGQKGGTAYSLTWKKYQKTGQDPYFKSGTQDYFEGVNLNISGMWLIDNEGVTTDAAFTSFTTFNNTVAAWFWVNTTTDYTISNIDDFYYNSSGTFNLEVTDNDGSVSCSVDVRRDSNSSSIFGENKWEGDGTRTVYKNNSYFWSAGNYTAYAYADLDEGVADSEDDQCYYLEENMDKGAGYLYYNNTYGANAALTDSSNSFAAATNYDWSLCGPWDPPEYNATLRKLQVETNEPYTDVQNETQYWGFDGEVNITIKETSSVLGSFTSNDVTVKVYDDDDVDVTSQFCYKPGGSGQIDKTNVASGWILINMTNWGKNKTTGSFADNGTWKAFIYVDVNSDRGNNNKTWTEEWNATAEWDVKKAPKAQFKWIDDDGSVGGTDKWGHSKNTNNDGVIPYVPGVTNVPLYVQFQVLSQGGYYFGDTAHSGECTTLTMCKENITITGNALFTGTFDKIPGIDYGGTASYGSANTWTVPIIPTMDVGGGEIKITVDAYNSTTSETIQIGGNNYGNNGSYVTVTPNEFDINDENQSLTITVTDSGSNVANPYADVYLYYINDIGGVDDQYDGDGIVSHVGSNDYSNGYLVPFNKSEQFKNQSLVDFDDDGAADGADPKAPRNLTIYVDGSGRRDGYALISMDTIDDLELELSHDMLMAGYAYDDFFINCTFAGNSTDTPSTENTDINNFYIKIYNKNDNDVTDTLLNGINSNDLTGDKDYIYGGFNNVYSTAWKKSPYTLYAYNNTHTSKGYNATLYVNPVNVVCDKAPLIWSADNNITATFTMTYDGKYNETLEGDFRLENVTAMSPSTGDYNKTWTNTSDANDTLDIDSDKITDGVVTVNDLTANYLESGETNQTITFYFRPTQSSSTWASAGTMLVRVPQVTPEPMYIPTGKTTRVTCMVTGRGEGLSDVYVRAHGAGGVDTNGTSDSDGDVLLALTPSASGNISIDVGEEGRTLDNSEAVIIATNWVLDVAVSPDTVDEGESFTITVTEESSGEAVKDATVTINGIGSMDTDENGEATFTAPKVTSDRTYTIKVTKEGYAPEPDAITIFVTNIPELVISADAKVQAGATFDVAVAKDTGDPVVGATVTLDGEEYKTKAGGVATLTAPDKAGTYTITATFKDFTDAETTIKVEAGGVPGFELLTLIAAIGVAFIILRRRRNK